jgi:membrane associated rhomboid family serine protease
VSVIPLRDVIRSRTFPFVTIGLITVNALAFLFELALPAQELQRFLLLYGVVPAMFSWPTVFTSMFLHSGWLHFLGNMLYLWIFGDNVEDRLGHLRYLAFYLLCGTVAVLAQIAFNPASRLPTIGASGAIAGVMGAYIILYPASRIVSLFPLFIFWQIVEVPAVVFLGFWFLLQFFAGIGSLAVTSKTEVGGVAFWAHVAGFLMGTLGVALFGGLRSRRAGW